MWVNLNNIVCRLLVYSKDDWINQEEEMFVKVKSFLKIELLFLILLVSYIKAVPSKNINIVAGMLYICTQKWTSTCYSTIRCYFWLKIPTFSAEYEAEFYREYVHYLSSKQISGALSKLLDTLSSTESKILLDDVPSAIDVS